MTEIKTLPDVWYTVTTENGCTIYRADGTRMLKEIEPGQGFFRAVENKVFCSDPDAIFRPFEPAPRLKLALLQGGAGGWLPKGFTELEYLESSGTQRIDTGVLMTDDTRIKAVAVATAVGQNNSLYGLSDLKNNLILRGRQQTANTFTVQIGSTADVEYTKYECYFTVILGDVVDVESVSIQTVSVNGVTKNGNYVTPWESSVPMHVPIFVMAYTYGAAVQYNAYGSYKLYGFSIWHGKEKLRDFAPILDETGTPCLYDRVSRQCFKNEGSGTFGYRIKRTGETVAPMSLRDPYYVAPSGVYARLVAENELEILADTEETTGDGWEWFANTAEAYEHFGILPQEEELLTE